MKCLSIICISVPPPLLSSVAHPPRAAHPAPTLMRVPIWDLKVTPRPWSQQQITVQRWSREESARNTFFFSWLDIKMSGRKITHGTIFRRQQMCTGLMETGIWLNMCFMLSMSYCCGTGEKTDDETLNRKWPQGTDAFKGWSDYISEGCVLAALKVQVRRIIVASSGEGSYCSWIPLTSESPSKQ